MNVLTNPEVPIDATVLHISEVVVVVYIPVLHTPVLGGVVVMVSAEHVIVTLLKGSDDPRTWSRWRDLLYSEVAFSENSKLKK